MGTMNGIDERFDGETYLRTMVERGLVKFAAGQLEKGETGNIHLQYYIQRETDDVRHDQAPDMSPQPLGGG